MSNSDTPTASSCWKNAKLQDWSAIDCVCIGTGRFLRSVLVPVVAQRLGPCRTALIQPRGRAFLEFMQQNEEQSKDGTYPVDTVLAESTFDKELIQTDHVSIGAAFSWGSETDRTYFLDQCLPHMKGLQVIAVGITEAGLASPDTPAMQQLFAFIQRLALLYQKDPPHWNASRGKIVVLNTDNLPQNGAVLRQHVLTLAERLQGDDNSDDSSSSSKTRLLVESFVHNHMAFLDTMVDRIVSERLGSKGLVPRAEPTPLKALVILDPNNDLPQWFTEYNNDDDANDNKKIPPPPQQKDPLGVVVRQERRQLDADVALKLCIANATHTAVAHIMALSCLLNTTELGKKKTHDESAKMLVQYMDAMVQHQIHPAVVKDLQLTDEEVDAVWQDWRQRVTHPTFGASTLFITQNGPAKGGIRIGPTVRRLIEQQQAPVQISLAFAMAVLLRWLTPSTTAPPKNGIIYRGTLATKHEEDFSTVTYADGLQDNLGEGWYEFKCDCPVVREKDQTSLSIAEWLAELGQTSPQPQGCLAAVRAYLVAPTGGNLQSIAQSTAFEEFASATSTLYARMIAGDHPMDILKEIHESRGAFTKGWQTPCRSLTDGPLVANKVSSQGPLHYRPPSIPNTSALLTKNVSTAEITSVLTSEVASVQAIDLHTHLLPPTHGPLCLWGIDELLTYHYLVAEFFMTAPASLTPEAFYSLSKKEQADMIWKALFVQRSPISEACRGVVTTLIALGLESAVKARDLSAIRAFYKSYQDRGVEGAKDFSNLVFDISGVRYNIMTNIPFDSNEAQYWRGPHQTDYDKIHFHSAVRVDPLLAGDREAIEFALRSNGYEVTLEGARQYLRDWCDTMKPVYVMASTPHDFRFGEDNSLPTGKRKSNFNEATFTEPGAFANVAKAASGSANCDGTQDDVPSVIHEHSYFLTEVLMNVCEERDLPLALKIGAHRAVNPALKQAGDGVVAFADTGVLSRLCTRFPKVRFLATFLSRNNQHEACVLATKFRNLHIYGCWWFCNNPSIIREITTMRIEMLGTAFTCQHSDARVLDQLIYKWAHSRRVVADVLSSEYTKLVASGWEPTRAEIRRDVARLFGGSYADFMDKSLL